MYLWKNTETLAKYEKDLKFSTNKNIIKMILAGSKKINYSEFPNLKYIFRAGVGRDNILESDLKKFDIKLFLPSKYTRINLYEETANYTCYLIFKLIFFEKYNKKKWIKIPRKDLKDKKLLIVGMGNIGKRVLRKMKQFMKIETYDIKTDNKTNLLRKLKIVDCVTFHIPGDSKNINLINKKNLCLFKKDVVIINTSRAHIFNETDLFQYLKKNINVKAAFDVFWKEPYRGKLSVLKNFFMSPHIASNSNNFLIGCKKDLDKIIFTLNKKK